ncbi:MAG: transposase [Promethearchaeota archaeon]
MKRSKTLQVKMRPHLYCPAGKRMYHSGNNVILGGKQAMRFRGNKSNCRNCNLRTECLRTTEKTEVRSVAYFKGLKKDGTESYTQKMKRKIDSIKGRLIYNRRLGTAEPPFAHIRSILRLDRFSLRGKRKVNTQWLLYCIVHNLTKVHRYGEGFA